MRLFLLLLLLPLSAAATELSNCDHVGYPVVITNAGTTREQMLPPIGSIYEYGPQVSFAIKGHEPVIVTQPGSEYCIWSGKITLQRLSTGNSNATGSAFR